MRYHMRFPRVLRLQQSFDTTHITHIPAQIAQEMSKLGLEKRIKPGDTVAVTAGSRGVANIALIIKSVVQELQKRGAKPYVIPAMGSHGGATAEGQRAVLESYGITERAMGGPSKATIETNQGGGTPEKNPGFVHN